YRFELVGDVNDGQRVFVRAETDLAIPIHGVRALGDDALGFVGVAVEREAASGSRRCRVADVDDVKAALTGAGTDRVCKARVAVERERVRGAQGRVVRGLR